MDMSCVAKNADKTWDAHHKARTFLADKKRIKECHAMRDQPNLYKDYCDMLLISVRFVRRHLRNPAPNYLMLFPTCLVWQTSRISQSWSQTQVIWIVLRYLLLKILQRYIWTHSLLVIDNNVCIVCIVIVSKTDSTCEDVPQGTR
jgi:hypothetical protein